MKQQHVDLLNEFSSKHGGWNSKMTKISPGNILLVCPPEMFDALGRCLLSEKSGWKSSARGDNSGTEQFYAFEPFTPFSKYQTLKKQAGDSCTKVIFASNFSRRNFWKVAPARVKANGENQDFL